MSFAANYEQGKAGESAIARWLRGKGCSLLPVYEKIISEGKGPTLFPELPHDPIVAPDLLVWEGNNVRWIEAKHKHGFTKHRQTGDWVTGIDGYHFDQYLQVEMFSPWPVWLLFLQRGGQTKDSPEISPEGLFGGPLRVLVGAIHHRCTADQCGKGGMVYWAREKLELLASLDAMGLSSLATRKEPCLL